jgi:hypothetical protein
MPLLAAAQGADDEAARQAEAIESLRPVIDTSQISERSLDDTTIMDVASDAGDDELVTGDDGAEAANEVDDIDPAVPSAVLSEDITRGESGGAVMDRMELGRTEITGNQELPKVLYIVPWQKADAGELDGRPINTLLDEVLAPVDREEFVRSVDYFDELNGVVEE